MATDTDSAEPDDNPDDVTEPTAPTAGEIRMQQHRSQPASIDWSRATVGLVQSLARAQARIATVGKDAENKDQKYRYATMDALVGEARRAFAAEGLALTTSYRVLEWTGPSAVSRKWDSDAKEYRVSQWIDTLVVVDFVLAHGSDYVPPEGGAVRSEIGIVTGFAECPAICSAGRPPDKAMFAARTEAHGVIALGLAQIDRAVIDDAEDIHRRQGDEDAAPRSRASTPARRDESRRETVIRDAVSARVRTLNEVRKAKGKPNATQQQLVDEAVGEPLTLRTPEDWQRALDALDRMILATRANARE